MPNCAPISFLRLQISLRAASQMSSRTSESLATGDIEWSRPQDFIVIIDFPHMSFSWIPSEVHRPCMRRPLQCVRLVALSSSFIMCINKWKTPHKVQQLDNSAMLHTSFALLLTAAKETSCPRFVRMASLYGAAIGGATGSSTVWFLSTG